MATTLATSRSSDTEEMPPVEFVPTPERISQYLERNAEDVKTRLESVDGRRGVYDELMQHVDDLKQAYPTFKPDDLQRQLDLVGDTLRKKQSYLEDQQLPEKRNMFQRSFDRVKTFAKKHPVVTTVLVTAAVAAAVAGGFYFTGNWELLTAAVGANKWMSGAKAVEELLPVTPPTELLPGGGVYELPIPNLPVDIPPSV